MPTIHTDVVRNPTRENKERFLVFIIAVAGKTARVISDKVRAFLSKVEGEKLTPFEKLKFMKAEDKLQKYMREVKLGQYTKLEKAFSAIIKNKLDVETCTLEELRAIPGVGPKSARYFMLYTRPDMEVAVLDTHILRYLREELKLDAPKTTPSSLVKYGQLEQAFLKKARDLGKSPKELDDMVWNMYNKGEIKSS